MFLYAGVKIISLVELCFLHYCALRSLPANFRHLLGPYIMFFYTGVKTIRFVIFYLSNFYALRSLFDNFRPSQYVITC
jgi:hypothetical protein